MNGIYRDEKIILLIFKRGNTREETHGLKTDSYDYYVRPMDEF